WLYQQTLTSPLHALQYFDRRCVTKQECHSFDEPGNDVFYKAILNQCEKTCPAGYMENPTDRHQCDHCGGDCPKGLCACGALRQSLTSHHCSFVFSVPKFGGVQHPICSKSQGLHQN